MTFPTWFRRIAAAAFLFPLGCWVVGVPGSASAAPGDVTLVGGQGSDSVCKGDGAGVDDGTGPLASAKLNYRSFANVRSLAVDASGMSIFVPDRTVVRGVAGYVAGVPPKDPPSSSSTSSTLLGTVRGLTGADAEGADPKLVRLQPMAVAVDAQANNLYILEMNGVRQMNLKGQPAIHTIVRGPTEAELSALPEVNRRPLFSTGSAIAADTRGGVYTVDGSSGTVSRVDAASKQLVPLTTVGRGTPSLTVDAGGTALYATDGTTVQRIHPVSGTNTVVAGGGNIDQDGVLATSVSLSNQLAVAVDPLGGHLYISDGHRHRIRKVDLSTGIINTVVGSGQAGFQASGKASTLPLDYPTALAVDLVGNVYILASDECAVLKAETPAVIFTPPPSSTPVSVPPPTTTPTGSTGQDSETPGADPALSGNSQANEGGTQQSGAPAQETQIVPGSQAQAQQPAQTELRIIDQGNVVTTPEPAAQSTAAPTPSPGTAAQFTPAPTPADVSTAVAPDPGPTGAAAADASPVVPPAPAAAPVPPAPAAAPVPPAAEQPVSSPGVVHGDNEAPARGATRYAMVRNDEDQSLAAALAMAGAGAGLAVFLCVMFVAPGASSKPKPRPKGAY